MKKVDVGDTVSAGNPVFSVLDLDPVKVRVGIPEAEIGKVHEGARAVVTIPSLDNRQFEGKVEAVGYSADSVSRTFTTKIAIPNPTHVLRAGMISESRVYDSAMVDVLAVPSVAVVRRSSRPSSGLRLRRYSATCIRSPRRSWLPDRR